MIIDFIDETGSFLVENQKLVEELLNIAANMEKVPEDAEVSVTFVDNKYIQEINREYRGKDTPTDVISFALEELGEGEIEVRGEDIPLVLGDIIISLERAQEQAEDYDHSMKREVGFLAVHGLLHLLGYDHENEEDEKKMFQRQKDILNAYGLNR